MMDLGITHKVQEAIEDSEYDALLTVGADNVEYLCGAPLPFLYYRYDQRTMVLWPRNGVPTCICPAELGSSMRHLGRIDRIHTYCATGDNPDGAARAVARSVRKAVEPGAKIGIDTGRVPCDLYEALQQALPEMTLVAGDAWLRDLRMVKTTPEMELLGDVAYSTDHAINGSLHHVIVASPRTQLTEAEQVRVHCLERGLVETGYHSVAQVAGGPLSQKLWPLCPTHGFNYGFSGTSKLEAGQMVRLSMRATLDGYWSDASRILVMGQPTPEQKETYANLVALRQAMIEHIASGVKGNDVFQAATVAANQRGIELVSELGVGHGIGVTPYESPFLAKDDDTELRSGMVLVLDPVIYGPNKEIVRSKDTVIVTDSGCRIVAWWKDWREPYIPIDII